MLSRPPSASSTAAGRSDPCRPSHRGRPRGRGHRAVAAPRKDRKLDELLQRHQGNLPSDGRPAEPAEPCAERQPAGRAEFLPLEPTSLAEAKLTEGEVEALILKLLAARSDASGRANRRPD